MSEWLGVPIPVDPNRCVTHAGDHLEGLLKRLGIEQGVEEERLVDSWKEIAGDYVAQHTRPAKLLKGTLEVQVLQPAMRFHLEQMKPELTRKLKQAFGPKLIRQVRFTLG